MNTATAPERQQLTAAFRNFTELSQALEVSYRDLEAQVARLSAELVSARRERVRQLEERDRLADRLQRLLAVLPGGVLVLDAAETVLECNPAAIEMLAEPLVGESWAGVVKRAFTVSTPLGGEVVLGSGRHITVSRRTLGPDAGAIVLLSDVTEAHLVRELLARHQRLSTLGEMAARLAHQIRTPLAAALLHAARVGHPDLDLDERATLQEKVVGRLRHLEQLVADMLTFARGGGGAMATCDVNALLEEAAQSLFGRLAGGARLRIRTEAPGLCVHGQRDALVGAIVNLATNALEAGGQAAEVQIECGRDGDRAVIRVSDNGPGIAPALRERIFEPFFTTRTGGTGLGLAVVKSVATAHGGEVRLEAGDGPGTRFTLELPALAPGASAEVTP